MNIAVPIDLAEDRPLPRCLTEGREPGPPAVTYIGKRPRETSITCIRTGGCDSTEICKAYDDCKVSRTSVEQQMYPTMLGAPPVVDMAKLGSTISRNPLDEIAAAVRKLTYEEMMTFAQGLWNVRPKSELIRREDYPTMLHLWSTGQERK